MNSEERIASLYNMVSLSLITHVARYADEGVKLTYSFYDIDKNGTNELLVGASGSLGAIYTYNSNTKRVAKIFFQDTLEREQMITMISRALKAAGVDIDYNKEGYYAKQVKNC